MRIVFMGTPDFALPALDALMAAGHHIVAVYCQPPRPAGRGKALSPAPVHRRAEALGLTVETPRTLKDAEAQARFAAYAPDVAIVAAYGLILPHAILDTPPMGCINIHGSLLPRWRGAAPVQRAILAGDSMTGVTIMQMEAGLDTGPMRAHVETEVADKSAGALAAELAESGAKLLLKVLQNPHDYPPVAQPEQGVTYAAKIEKAEARLNFSMPVDKVARHVRAFNPAPGAFFELAGERFRILSAHEETGEAAAPGTVVDDHLGIACANGILRPILIQRAGRGAMPVADLLRGFSIPQGTMLA